MRILNLVIIPPYFLPFKHLAASPLLLCYSWMADVSFDFRALIEGYQVKSI